MQKRKVLSILDGTICYRKSDRVTDDESGESMESM